MTVALVAQQQGARRRWRLSWRWVLALILALLFGFVVSTSSRPPEPLAITSASPDGTKAMARLLERFGAPVRAAATPRDGDVALLLADDLDQSERAAIVRWVRSGGTLVVADPTSPLVGADVTGAPAGTRPRPRLLVPGCDDAGVAGVAHLDLGPGGRYDVFASSTTGTSCFVADDGAFMDVSRYGLGTVVSLGSPALFTNARLDAADNSVLVERLLGSGRAVTVLRTEQLPGTGGQGLLDVMDPRVRFGAWQVVVAAVLLALWRGRRFGPVVEEPLPAEVPGSRLVRAVGDLLRLSGDSSAAARTLRGDLRREVADVVGAPIALPVEDLVALLVARTGLPVEQLRDALVDSLVDGDDELVRLARTIEEVHREVTHVR